MNANRIKAILLHSWYYQKNSFEAWVDTIWWSLVSIFVYGYMTLYFAGSDPVKAQYILLGFLFWDIVRLAQESIALSVLRDIWSRNLSNLFTTPISTMEFFTAELIFGAVKGICVFLISSTVAYFVYGFSVFSMGWPLIVYFLLLFLFSCSAGIFILGLLFRFGTRVQAFCWSLIVILQPITGVFYPLSILPIPIQYIARLFPVTYVFESARSKLATGQVHWEYILIALAENLVFGVFAVWFFKRMHRISKEKGVFARLEG